MSTLLLHISGSKLFNFTIFPPQLYIHDDLLLYKKLNILSSREITISYNQISQITLNLGILFASLDIVTTGTDDIAIKFLKKSAASKAKKIIDQKIYHSHAKHHEVDAEEKQSSTRIEKSIARLEELLAHGTINKREYEHKKNQLMKEL